MQQLLLHSITVAQSRESTGAVGGVLGVVSLGDAVGGLGGGELGMKIDAHGHGHCFCVAAWGDAEKVVVHHSC